MATSFPGSLDSFVNPSGSDALDSVSVPHATQHADLNDAVEALQAKVGVDGSADTSSLDYKVAQQGLVLVKTQTVGSAVTTVTLTGLTGFDVYQFVFDRIDPTAGALLIIDDFTSLTGSGWNGTTLLWNSSGTPVVYTNTNSADAYFGLFDTNRSACTLTVYNLNQTGRTRFHAMSQYQNGFAIGGGMYNFDTTSTTLTFKTSSGTMTGGTIRVYGYNNG